MSSGLQAVVSRRMVEGPYSTIQIVDMLACGHELAYDVTAGAYPHNLRRRCPTCAGEFTGGPGTYPVRENRPR